MIPFLFSICLIINDFGKNTFNSTTSSFQIPYIIFPYFLHHANQLNIFNDFQESIKDNTEIATAQINCLNSRTTCSKLELQPGYIHISYPPHDPKKNIKRINKEFETIDFLTKVYQKIYNENVFTFKKCSIDDVYANMTENSSDVIYPAFVLASKLQNLDDLNEKLALFKQIALEYINTDILFAYITEPSIYDTFDISPKTEIIYISPFHKNIIFNSNGNFDDRFEFESRDKNLVNYFSSSDSDFTVDDLRNFVEIHKIPFLADPYQYHLDSSKKIFLTVVNNYQFLEQNEIIEKLKNIHSQLPVIFIDNSKNPFLSSAVCRDFNNFNSVLKSHSNSVFSSASCLALVDFSSSSSIILNQTLINDLKLYDINEKVQNFVNIYNNHTTFGQKIYQKFMFELDFNQHTVISFVAALFSILIVVLGMIFSCRNETKKKKSDNKFAFPPAEKVDKDKAGEKEKKD